MASRTTLLACTLALLAAPLVAPLPARADDATDPTTPLGAVAVDAGGSAFVSWAPGTQVPDSFVVYGLDGGVLVRLALVPGSAVDALVPGGFSAYAVAALHAGTESPPKTAVAARTLCVTVVVDVPPKVAVGCLA
jgi:hypothetical protein